MSQRQDATIFEADDSTPFFGTGDGIGGVVVPDFSTDPTHPRPYLFEVKNWSASEIDFPAGSSNLGGITLEVLDKRTDASDQDTGLLTSRLGEVKGKRLLFRREHPTLGMVAAFDAVVLSYSMGGSPEGLVKVTLQLGDIRERERDQPLFRSNLVLLGADGASGPAINYGALPGGGYLLDAVGPFESIVSGGISHFQRITGFTSNPGIVAGVAPVPAFAIPSGLLYPQQDSDGIWRYRGIQIRWRPKGTDDDWIYLRDMPWINSQPVLTLPNTSIVGEAFAGTPFAYTSATTLTLSSMDEYDIPETGQEIEFQVMAVEITEDSPFWWDGGTYGDLLREIYDGEHSQEPPKIRYNAADMAAFQASTPPARFTLRKPVEDMRAWVEKFIYQPLGYAPGFDAEMAISPVSWAFPANTATIPLIDADVLVPVGDWEDGPDNVINTVSFTYIRESLESTRTIQDTKSPPWWKFWASDVQTEIPDPDDTRLVWQRIIETPVTNTHVNIESIATWGEKKLEINGLLARSIAGADGLPYGGDTQDELGAQMDAFISEQALGRFSNGAATYNGGVLASDPNTRDLRSGQWVRFQYWPPNYDTGRRGVRRYFQIISLSDEDPSRRILRLIDGNVEDTTNDDGSPGGTDCASGGTLFPASEGKAVRLFTEDGFIVTTCAITCDLLAVAGGGGGGSSAGGGGGGAGGVRRVDSFFIAANQTIPVTVGAGGAADANGEHTTIWVDADGFAMDPDTDDPDDAIRALLGGKGGAAGVGTSGGSAGGSGNDLPGTGGGVQPGGTTLDPDQGHDGGASENEGGTATCQAAAGGGGGSYAGPGTAGHADTDPGGGSAAGIGGPSHLFEDFGITVGGGGNGGAYDKNAALPPSECSQQVSPGDPGASGYGAGGAGGAGPAPVAGPGFPGCAAILYTGPIAPLVPPVITSTETTDQNQNTICIEAADWPPVPEGYTVRVEYAVSLTEPDATSGLWRYAGPLDAPGCVTTPPVPTGAVVWSRAIATAPGYLPSDPGTAVDETTPSTPGLLALGLVIGSDGVAVLTWTPNLFSDALRIRGMVAPNGESTTPPLPILADVDALGGTYTLDDLVPPGEYATLDVEAWEDDTYTTLGRIYRVSKLNPVRDIVTRADGLDALSDVELTPPQAGDVLAFDAYGMAQNRRFRLDEWDEADDNTDLNASTAAHGLMAKLSGDASKYIGGDGAEHSIPPGEWTEVIATVDQDVTNNGTEQNDSELVFACTAGVYVVELLLIYSGSDATADFRYTFDIPSSTDIVRWAYGARSATNATQILSPASDGMFGAVTTLGPIICGTKAAHALSVDRMWLMAVIGASGNFQFKFCNDVAAALRVSRRKAGSILRYRKLT